MFVPSCDDEPPEPLIEGIAGDFNAVAVIDAGIAFRVPVRRVSPIRTPTISPKSKKRELRALRSYVLVASLLDSRCALETLASVWQSSVRSLGYRSRCLETPRTVKGPVASRPASLIIPRPVTVSPTCPEPAVTTKSLVHDAAPPEKEQVCIPTIVVTPPPPSDIDWACYNAVPTPQNAAHGKLLTVPDRDLRVINRYGRSNHSFGGSFQAKSSLPWCRSKQPSLAAVPASRPQVAVTCSTPVRRPPFVDEEDDDVIDLGPTWSG